MESGGGDFQTVCSQLLMHKLLLFIISLSLIFSLLSLSSLVLNQRRCSPCLNPNQPVKQSRLFTAPDTSPLVHYFYTKTPLAVCVCVQLTHTEGFTASSWFVSKNVCVTLHTSQAGSATPICLCPCISVCNTHKCKAFMFGLPLCLVWTRPIQQISQQ